MPDINKNNRQTKIKKESKEDAVLSGRGKYYKPYLVNKIQPTSRDCVSSLGMSLGVAGHLGHDECMPHTVSAPSLHRHHNGRWPQIRRMQSSINTPPPS